MFEWISIDDKKPENHQRVLFFNGCVHVGWRENSAFKNWPIYNDLDSRFSGVTHWMPLPECPDITDGK